MESCHLVVVAILLLVLLTAPFVLQECTHLPLKDLVIPVKLVTTVLEEYVLNVILEPSLLLVLDIVLLAVAGTSVVVINE
jgi:hypothetical protein